MSPICLIGPILRRPMFFSEYRGDRNAIACCHLVSKRSNTLRNRTHFFQTQLRHFTRIASPQILAEQFQREPPAVSGATQQLQIPTQIDMAVAGHHAAVIVLLDARR